LKLKSPPQLFFHTSTQILRAESEEEFNKHEIPHRSANAATSASAMDSRRIRKLRHLLDRSQRATEDVTAIASSTAAQLSELHSIMAPIQERTQNLSNAKKNLSRCVPLDIVGWDEETRRGGSAGGGVREERSMGRGGLTGGNFRRPPLFSVWFF
jgi:hypothetical protein